MTGVSGKALGNYVSNLALKHFLIIFNKIINIQRTVNVNAGKKIHLRNHQ